MLPESSVLELVSELLPELLPELLLDAVEEEALVAAGTGLKPRSWQ